LTQAVKSGVTQPVRSSVIDKSIPKSLRDPDGHWFGLTRRARVVYASKDRVDLDSITYEELADPKWRNKICTRSGQHTYNVALVASMIAHHGKEEAEKWLEGLKANLARKPAGGDRDSVRDVKAGSRDRQHLLHGRHAQEPGPEGMGRRCAHHLPQRQWARYAR
jgi:iron(III) transport system substrate-binding protein